MRGSRCRRDTAHPRHPGVPAPQDLRAAVDIGRGASRGGCNRGALVALALVALALVVVVGPAPRAHEVSPGESEGVGEAARRPPRALLTGSRQVLRRLAGGCVTGDRATAI